MTRKTPVCSGEHEYERLSDDRIFCKHCGETKDVGCTCTHYHYYWQLYVPTCPCPHHPYYFTWESPNLSPNIIISSSPYTSTTSLDTNSISSTIAGTVFYAGSSQG